MERGDAGAGCCSADTGLGPGRDGERSFPFSFSFANSFENQTKGFLNQTNFENFLKYF
jgi:hypothetical protein